MAREAWVVYHDRRHDHRLITDDRQFTKSEDVLKDNANYVHTALISV